MTPLRTALRRGLAVGAAVLVGATMVSACTAASEPKPFHPTLAWGPCPDDVETTFLTAHECGTLTVLANRTRPGGGTVKLLVAKVPPPAGATMPGVGTSFGANFGDAESVGGEIAAGTARLGRTTLQLEWRGSGPHSTPSLRCPEVDPLGPQAAAVRDNDPGVLTSFVAAVGRCAARLRSDGVEPADYTATAMAQDVEDLRTAAGIDHWAMGASYGTQSAVLMEYLRLFPDRVQAAYLDSPRFSGPAASREDEMALRQTLDALFRECSQTPKCQAAHPDLGALWIRALARTTDHPLRGTAQVGAQKVAVLVDGAKLVRAARFALGGEGGPLTALPRIIDEAAHGHLAPELATMVAKDPLFCSGYRPQCRDTHFSLGLFLTDVCSTPPPNRTPTDAVRRPGAGLAADSAYSTVFDASPYTKACAAWKVPALSPEPPLSRAAVPMLLMSGDLDSFSPPASTRTAAGRLGPTAHVLNVPGGIHNVLGYYECAITARNDWTRHPQLPPTSTACDTAARVEFR